MQPHRIARRRFSHVAVTAALGLLLSACAGENLFSLAGSVGDVGPTVEITAPSEALTVGMGASLVVRAEVTAPDGLRTAEYRGVYAEGGANAYVSDLDNFTGAQFASLETTLSPVPAQEAGAVLVIVRITDGQGAVLADTVHVTVN